MNEQQWSQLINFFVRTSQLWRWGEFLSLRSREAMTSTSSGFPVQFCSIQHLEIKSVTIIQHSFWHLLRARPSAGYWKIPHGISTRESSELSGKEQRVNKQLPPEVIAISAECGLCTMPYGNRKGVCQDFTEEGESWWWSVSWSEEGLEGIQESRNIMCKDMKLIKNTCLKDLKEILYGLRPEVQPVEKIIWKKPGRERQ